jgi:hypothetical protein
VKSVDQEQDPRRIDQPGKAPAFAVHVFGHRRQVELVRSEREQRTVGPAEHLKSLDRVDPGPEPILGVVQRGHSIAISPVA